MQEHVSRNSLVEERFGYIYLKRTKVDKLPQDLNYVKSIKMMTSWGRQKPNEKNEPGCREAEVSP